ncbi:MAG: leucine-rich repeat protein [Malacoplasma sp.]|nr:leucine-rich repeat protein [Malacoplasma sp.]
MKLTRNKKILIASTLLSICVVASTATVFYMSTDKHNLQSTNKTVNAVNSITTEDSVTPVELENPYRHLNEFCSSGGAGRIVKYYDINGQSHDVKMGDILSLKLTNVYNTDIGSGFLNDCNYLKELDLSGAKNVTTIDYDFLSNCHQLETLDLSGLINVKTISTYFMYKCNTITSVDLSPMTKLTKIDSSFLNYCLSLQTLNIGNIAASVFTKDDDYSHSLICYDTSPSYINGVQILGKENSEFCDRFPNSTEYSRFDRRLFVPSESISIEGGNDLILAEGDDLSSSQVCKVSPIHSLQDGILEISSNPQNLICEIKNNKTLYVAVTNPAGNYNITLSAHSQSRPDISTTKSITVSVLSKPNSVIINDIVIPKITYLVNTNLQFSASFSPTSKSTDFLWETINEPIFAWIESDTGLLHLSEHNEVGQYSFDVKATSVMWPDLSCTKTISFEIKYEPVQSIDLKNQIHVVRQAERGGERIYTNVEPFNSCHELYLDMKSKPDWLKVENETQWVDDILFTWEGSQQLGQYNVVFDVYSVADPSIKKSYNWDIEVIGAIPTSIEISGASEIYYTGGNSGSSQYTAMVSPSSEGQYISWSVLDAPNWLKIDKTGKLYWGNDCPTDGVYNIKIKASASYTVNDTLNVKFVLIKGMTYNEKLGLGLGLGIGIPVLILVITLPILYNKGIIGKKKK